MKKFKNVGGKLLRFSIGTTEHTVRPGSSVTLPSEEPYVVGLVATGVLKEKPVTQAAQIALNLSSDAGSAPAPATTPKPASPAPAKSTPAPADAGSTGGK